MKSISLLIAILTIQIHSGEAILAKIAISCLNSGAFRSNVTVFAS